MSNPKIGYDGKYRHIHPDLAKKMTLVDPLEITEHGTIGDENDPLTYTINMPITTDYEGKVWRVGSAV